MLKTYIICSGFIWGCGEDLFSDYFIMSWLENPRKLPIIGKGKNIIPTIHIIDSVSFIKRIIKINLKINIFLQLSILKIDIWKILLIPLLKELVLEKMKIRKIRKNPKYKELSINLKMKPTKLLLDEKEMMKKMKHLKKDSLNVILNLVFLKI